MKTKIVKILFFILFAIIMVNLVQAQPDVVWTRVIGGYNFDKAYWVEETDDLGFIIVGETYSYGAGEADVYLIKTDSLGLPEWTRTFGGAGVDVGYCVRQTSDYGYIIAGKIDTWDVYLIKTDAAGYETWSRTFTAFSSGNCVCQTDDGGYIITGNKYSGSYQDIFLLKTDGFGQEQWSQSYGGSGIDRGQCVHKTSDGGYAIFGSTSSFGVPSQEVYLIKTNVVGEVLWSQTYDGGGSEFCYSGLQALDGGYFMGGYNTDIVLIKTNYLGQESWTQTFGSIYQDFCIDVQQTWDGNYIMAGQTTIAGNNEAYIVKTDHLGNIIWELTVGEPEAESGNSIKQIHDGGYIICGSCGGPWSWDVYLIRLAPDAGAGIKNNGADNPPSGFALYPAFPNPFNQHTAISYQLSAESYVNLTVYDITGREVARLVDGYRNAGNHEVTFDAKDLTSGIYFARLQAGNFSETQKILLLK